MNVKCNALKSSLLLPASLFAAILSGCGAGGSINPPAPVQVAGKSASGMFMGGQQPVGGVALQLYAVGSGGYGSAATPLLTPGASMTTAAGNFNLSSYTCPTASTLVYLVGTGGQPIAAVGSTPAVTNNNLALMAALGACSTIGNSFINVNELSTIAAVWALSPFMTGISNIGSSSTNLVGIQNAFAAVNKVVNLSTGAISGPALPAGATLPIAEIDTLADILEVCVNSGGGVYTDTSTACGNLFSLAPDASGTVYPTDTITAAMNIAQSPARNVSQLDKVRSNSPVYQPVLSVNSPPNAWTIAISYVGGGLSSPQGLATDAAGNVWVANSGNSSVSEFASSGAAISGSNGFTAGGITSPNAIAIDLNGNPWVANSNNTITALASTGTTGTAYSGNGLSVPKSIAIDGSNNVWVANSTGSSVSAFTNAGAALTGSPYSGGGVSNAVSIAISPK